MSIINSGVVGRITMNQLQEQRRLISEKWSELGLLEGLSGVNRDNIALLFENQAAQLIKESTDTNGSNGSFEAVAFPIVRRIFSNLLANDIVSVQALSMPIGKLFYYNPKVSTTQTAYDGSYENAATNTNRTQFENKSLYDSFYHQLDANGEDISLFDKSKGKATVKSITSGITLTGNNLVITGFASPNGQGKLVTAEGHVIDTESFLASLTVKIGADAADAVVVPFSIAPQTWGKGIVDANGTIVLKVDTLIYDEATSAYTDIADKTYIEVKYKEYELLEQNSEMTEVTFELSEVVVSTTTRKMRANWTPELTQDVAAFQNIDAESELTTLLSETLASEIDREILRDLRKGAAWAVRWDYKGLVNGTAGANFLGTQKDYNQTLITKINQVAAQIQKATLRTGVSWIVVSPEVSAILDDLEYFHVSNAAPEENKYNAGIEKYGTLSGRYTVYKDNFAPHNEILVGIKGRSILETGYIYAPYIPMQLTPVLTNHVDFTSVRGIMTRYAKKMVNNRFYGKVLLDGVVKFDMNI